jgi:lipopolysaccharide export system permease protein
VRILDRYLLREFLSFLGLGLVTFLGIFVIVDVFEKVDTFVDTKAPVKLVVRFYLAYIPFVLVQILPVSMLLASLMSLGRFVRQHELTAMQMAGQSLWRAFAAVLIFGALVAMGAFYVEQWVVPEANYRRRMIMDHEIEGKPRPTAKRERDVKCMGEGGRIYSIKSFDPERQLMRDVTIEEFSRGFPVRRIDAQLGRWKGDYWQLTAVTIRTFDGDSLRHEQHDTFELHTPEEPGDFTREHREPEEIGWLEFRRHIRERILRGYDVTKDLVDWHTKLAFPVINFVVVLIGASLSTRIRKGGMAIGFGISLFISFIYYTAIRAGQSLGHGGALPPLLAAWIANIIFGSIGLVLFLRAQRGR